LVGKKQCGVGRGTSKQWMEGYESVALPPGHMNSLGSCTINLRAGAGILGDAEVCRSELWYQSGLKDLPANLAYQLLGQDHHDGYGKHCFLCIHLSSDELPCKAGHELIGTEGASHERQRTSCHASLRLLVNSCYTAGLDLEGIHPGTNLIDLILTLLCSSQPNRSWVKTQLATSRLK
jgi:hypothetical protein